MAISLGVYTKGEIPPRLAYTYLNASGTARVVTGFDAAVVVEAPDGTRTERAGQVDDGPGGTVSIDWVADMTDAPGRWSMVIWAGDGSNRYASPVIYYSVTDDTTPAI